MILDVASSSPAEPEVHGNRMQPTVSPNFPCSL